MESVASRLPSAESLAGAVWQVRMIVKRTRIGMYDVVQGMYCDWALGLFVGR